MKIWTTVNDINQTPSRISHIGTLRIFNIFNDLDIYMFKYLMVYNQRRREGEQSSPIDFGS